MWTSQDTTDITAIENDAIAAETLLASIQDDFAGRTDLELLVAAIKVRSAAVKARHQ